MKTNQAVDHLLTLDEDQMMDVFYRVVYALSSITFINNLELNLRQARWHIEVAQKEMENREIITMPVAPLNEASTEDVKS